MSDTEGGPDDGNTDQGNTDKDNADRDNPDSGSASTGGQVSEVQSMDAQDANTPISDSQGVAGQPDAESGDVQEGPAGPNAKIDRAHQQEDLDR
ncbi:hypothetical protein [Aeromicrobium sp. CF3.5]|uniref:hypothetical protein n=1 Tax=Aeromicrobium sp. CF3.5 TaxID=3373078 RepID=UPI003EE7B3AB